MLLETLIHTEGVSTGQHAACPTMAENGKTGLCKTQGFGLAESSIQFLRDGL